MGGEDDFGGLVSIVHFGIVFGCLCIVIIGSRLTSMILVVVPLVGVM